MGIFAHTDLHLPIQLFIYVGTPDVGLANKAERKIGITPFACSVVKKKPVFFVEINAVRNMTTHLIHKFFVVSVNTEQPQF
jgi:hypothetical protein